VGWPLIIGAIPALFVYRSGPGGKFRYIAPGNDLQKRPGSIRSSESKVPVPGDRPAASTELFIRRLQMGGSGLPGNLKTT